MLSSFMISQSGAQARALWYILKTAVCPVAGSTFSGSCFAVVGAGVFEQAVRSASRAIAGKMDGFSICTCVPILAMGARVRHAVHIRNAIFAAGLDNRSRRPGGERRGRAPGAVRARAAGHLRPR